MSRQQETVAVVAMALFCVLAYTIWGASVLRAEKQAASEGPSVVLNR